MPTTEIIYKPRRVQYYANAGQTVFVYDFIIFSQNDIVVLKGSTELTLSDYSVTGVLDPTGGTVVLNTPADLDDLITIYSDIEPARGSQYQPDGRLDAEPMERDFDTITVVLQEQRRDLSRTIRLAPEDQLTEFTLPVARANKFLAFNSLGVPVAADAVTTSGTPFGATGIDLAATTTPSEARTVIGLSSQAALVSAYSLGDLSILDTLPGSLIDSETIPYSAIASAAIATASEIRTATASKLVDAAQLLTALRPYSTTTATTSGASISFASIPAGVRRVVIGLAGVSSNGTGVWEVRLNSESSGYVGGSERAGGSSAFSSGFIVSSSVVAADVYSGALTLTRGDSSTNTWHFTGLVNATTGPYVHIGAGTKSLTAELSEITIIAGGNAFDAGKITCEAFYF